MRQKKFRLKRFGDRAVFGRPMAVLARFVPIDLCLVSNNTGSLVFTFLMLNFLLEFDFKELNWWLLLKKLALMRTFQAKGPIWS